MIGEKGKHLFIDSCYTPEMTNKNRKFVYKKKKENGNKSINST